MQMSLRLLLRRRVGTAAAASAAGAGVGEEAGAALGHVLLLTRALEPALAVYATALGLPVLAADARSAQLDAGGGVRLTLSVTDQCVPPPSLVHSLCAGPCTLRWLTEGGGPREAALSTGYTPFLNFAVRDFDATVHRLLATGARLDGPVKYPLQGKVAVAQTQTHTSCVLSRPTLAVYVCVSVCVCERRTGHARAGVADVRQHQAAAVRTPDGHMVGLYERPAGP
jgi:catechol 2,3-dioxygenase-like lactoylglutathione lyase family enzyme